MRLRLLATALVLGLALAFLLRGTAFFTSPSSERRGNASPGPDAPTATVDHASAREEVDWLPPPPPRNIFRYADVPVAPARAGRAPSVFTPAAEAPVRPPAAPPVLRLVGFVRRPEGLRAAVATASGVVLVAKGDLVLGHAVLGLDEDRGLRLRAPDGSDLWLAPPP